MPFEKLEESADLCIGEGDFAIIGARSVTAGVRFWSVIRRVRVVEMNPHKERSLGIGLEPLQRFIHHPIAPMLDGVQVHFLLTAQIKVIEIGVKTLVQAETRVEDGRSNEGCGRVSIPA